MLTRAEAVGAAFEAARGVRGRQEKEAALVSLALHAARTADARPFIAQDEELAARAQDALVAAGRRELALRVALWQADAGPLEPQAGTLAREVACYRRAKAWAEGGMERAELGWIRDVPGAPASRAVMSERLLLQAEAKGDAGGPLAAAALEAELAETPGPEAFGRVLQAASLARSPQVVRRTKEGLGMGARAGAGEEALLDGERLAAALNVELARAQGRPLSQAAEEAAVDLGKAPEAVRWALVAALAARIGAGGDRDRAVALLDPVLAERAAARGPARAPFLTALSVRLAFPPHELWAQAGADRALRFDPPERAFAAAAATRALRSPALALDAMGALFDPDDHVAMLSKEQSAPLATLLVREAARAAAVEGDAARVEALDDHVRRLGTRPPWEAYLRGLIVDAAAQIAAWHGKDAAWDAAHRVANARRLPPFERAKLAIRAACEFVRASEVARSQGPWADLLFGGPPRAAPIEVDDRERRG